MRAPGRLPVAGLVSGRPLPSPRLVPTGRVTTLGEGSAGSLPVEGAHSCLAARGVAQFLGLPGRLSYCCEREILPEVMLEA
jgi:hypothetical protein